MLERRSVTRETVRLLAELSVRPDQHGLVAPNAITLAEAPFETGSQVWGLWDGAVAVGLMAMVHPDLYPWHGPGDDRQAAYLWRLMIADGYQGRGYGRAAIEQAMAVTREWGLPRLVAGVATEAHSNIGFYEHLGFRRTGRVVEADMEIVIDL